MKFIIYKSGYKYQLSKEYIVEIGIRPLSDIITEYIELTSDGFLTIKRSYAWDGPSGPTIDTNNFMRGSIIHDALYQLMREKHLDHDKYREKADKLLQQVCIEDGMSAIRAWWVYQGVRFGGGPSADPANDKTFLVAPCLN